MSNSNPTEARIAVVGDVVGTNEQNGMTEVSVTYSDKSVWIPDACIKDTIKVSAQSVHLLQDATLDNGLTIKVADHYKLDTRNTTKRKQN